MCAVQEAREPATRTDRRGHRPGRGRRVRPALRGIAVLTTDRRRADDSEAARARRRFDDAFDALQARSQAAAEARSKRDLDEVTAEHVKLTELRREAWDAKKAIVSRREPATPDWVEPPIGPQESTRRGRVFAVIGAVLLAAVVPLAWWAVQLAQQQLEISVDHQQIVQVETDDGRNRCLLEITIGFVNDELAEFDVVGATAVVDRRRVGARVTTERIRAGQTGTFTVSVAAAPVTGRPCPGLGELERGTLTIDLRTVGTGVEIRRTARL